MADERTELPEDPWAGPTEYNRSPLAFLGRLRFRLTALVMLTVVPLLALIVHSTLQRRDAAAGAATTEMQRLARVTAGRLEEIFDGARRVAERVRDTEWVRDGDAKRVGEYLAGLRTGSPFTADIRLVDAEGRILASALSAEASAGLADADVVALAVRASAYAVGDVRLRDGDHPVTVDVALPLGSGDDPAEVRLVAVTVDVHALREFQRTFQLPSDATLAIVDPRGSVRASFPSGAGVGERHAVAGPGGSATMGGVEGLTAAGADGVVRLHGLAPVVTGGPVQGTLVVLGVPEETVLGPVRRALRDNLIWTLVITILAVLAVEILANRLIVQRVNGLILATRRVAHTPLADFKARDRVSQDPSELGDLERAFDEMTHSIQRQMTEHSGTPDETTEA